MWFNMKLREVVWYTNRRSGRMAYVTTISNRVQQSVFKHAFKYEYVGHHSWCDLQNHIVKSAIKGPDMTNVNNFKRGENKQIYNQTNKRKNIFFGIYF